MEPEDNTAQHFIRAEVSDLKEAYHTFTPPRASLAPKSDGVRRSWIYWSWSWRAAGNAIDLISRQAPTLAVIYHLQSPCDIPWDPLACIHHQSDGSVTVRYPLASTPPRRSRGSTDLGSGAPSRDASTSPLIIRDLGDSKITFSAMARASYVKRPIYPPTGFLNTGPSSAQPVT